MHRSIVITGPSGSGKSTLIKHILKTHPDILFSVSYTTRSPRHSELNGKDYHFVSIDEFQRLETDGRLIEYTVFGEQYYGTPVPSSTRPHVYDLDHVGVELCKKKFPEFLYIYIDCDRKIVEERLTRRISNGESSEKDVRRRMEAYDEFARLKKIDGYFNLVVDTSKPMSESLRILEEFIKQHIR